MFVKYIRHTLRGSHSSHPVASSKSEQVFSVAGNVVTQNRACLALEKACVIVKSNLGLLRDMGFLK